MIVPGACPDCEKIHALPVTSSRDACVLAECTHCGRLWPPEQTPSAPEQTAVRCKQHPGRPARWACESCDATLCDECSREIRTSTHVARLSPCCRASCLPVAPLRAIRPFWREPAAVLRYAVRGESLFVLVFLWFGGYVPILSWFVPVLLVVYGFHILRSSSRDPYRSPGFPDPEDAVTGLIYPFARFLGAALVAWAPLLLYRRFAGEEPASTIVIALSILGLVSFPAIVLPAATGASLTQTLDPARLRQTVLAMGRDYVATLAILVLVVVIWIVTGKLVARGDQFVIVTEPARIYAVLTAFHVLGRAILQTRDRIEWQL